jgi:DNA polymerase III sliding clamp (beta) subunit (PCNA family)
MDISIVTSETNVSVEVISFDSSYIKVADETLIAIKFILPREDMAILTMTRNEYLDLISQVSNLQNENS